MGRFNLRANLPVTMAGFEHGILGSWDLGISGGSGIRPFWPGWGIDDRLPVAPITAKHPLNVGAVATDWPQTTAARGGVDVVNDALLIGPLARGVREGTVHPTAVARELE